MSAALLNYLRFKSAVTYSKETGRSQTYGKDLPRFRYCFYLDILSSELDEDVQNALHHLREQSDYCRVLGSYPAKSRLVGPVAEAVEALNAANSGKPTTGDLRLQKLPSDDDEGRQMNIGLVGFGSFGAYLSKHLSTQHKVRCIDTLDKVCPILFPCYTTGAMLRHVMFLTLFLSYGYFVRSRKKRKKTMSNTILTLT
jgi:hypothetical protein